MGKDAGCRVVVEVPGLRRAEGTGPSGGGVVVRVRDPLLDEHDLPPSRASARAVAAPIPSGLFAPVTSATLPRSPVSTGGGLANLDARDAGVRADLAGAPVDVAT